MNYQKIYQTLIQTRKTRILEDTIYTETHHILPRCLGGTDDIDNLINLTPEEHVIAHLLLVKIHPNNPKLIYAANMMTNRIKNNKEYGWVKRAFVDAEKRSKIGIKRSKESIEKQRNTILEKYKNGYVSPILGTSLSEERKLAISKANKGKIISAKSKSNLEGYVMRYGEIEGIERYKRDSKKKNSSSLDSYVKRYGEKLGPSKYQERVESVSKKLSGERNSFYGKTHTIEVRKKISESTTGKPKFRSADHNKKIGLSNKGKKHEMVTCPHCGKQGGKSTMSQWHFDNCKDRLGGPIKVRAPLPIITCPHCGKSGNGPRIKSDHFDACKFAPNR